MVFFFFQIGTLPNSPLKKKQKALNNNATNFWNLNSDWELKYTGFPSRCLWEKQVESVGMLEEIYSPSLELCTFVPIKMSATHFKLSKFLTTSKKDFQLMSRNKIQNSSRSKIFWVPNFNKPRYGLQTHLPCILTTKITHQLQGV